MRISVTVPITFPEIVVSRTALSDPTASTIALSGFLEATDVNIVPEVSAQIVSLSVAEGDPVQAGQTVVVLDMIMAELVERGKVMQMQPLVQSQAGMVAEAVAEAVW